mgnify:FL=1
MNDITIEHVQPPSDSKRLEKILWELDDDIIPKLSERVNIEEYAKKLSANAEVFYVKHGDIDIGNCAVYMNNEETGFISSIAIKKEWQNKGIGNFLWEKIIVLANTRGIRTIELMVNKNNYKAITFYNHLQFTELKMNTEWIGMRYKL